MLRTLLLAAVAARGACVSVPPAPTTAVFGHKIPDTDAICAALAYEWELEARGMPARAYRLGELNRETEYVLNALGVDVPPLLDGALEPGAPVAVVDTNNPGELPEGIENAAVHSVIDHHKLTGLRTVAPLEVDMRPLCSAGSIIYARAKAAGRSVPKRIAGLLLSCILSDSLEFRSPTTTPIGARRPRPAPTPPVPLPMRRHRGFRTRADREYAEELAAIAGIDLHAHAEAMLDAKVRPPAPRRSDGGRRHSPVRGLPCAQAQLGGISPEELLTMDSKAYEIGGRKMRVSVIETTRPAAALAQREAMQAAMGSVCEREGLDEVLLFVVDIINEEAIFIGGGGEGAELVERAWAGECSADGTLVLPDVLSRKKQIIPALEAAARGEEWAPKNGAAARPVEAAAPPAAERARVSA